MLKVTVKRESTKAVFKVGELVELDHSKYEGGEGYVVLITKAPGNSQVFGGVVVQCDQTDTDIFVGDLSDNFARDSFTKFVGTLTLVSS